MKNKNKLKIAISVLTILAIGIGVYFYMHTLENSGDGNDSSSELNYGEPTEEQKEAGNKTKEQNISEDTDYNNGEGKPGEPYNSENEPDEPSSETPQDKVLEIEITQASKERNTLRVRSIIREVAVSGNCTLKLEKSGETSVTKTVSTQVASSYTTCKGFDIPTNGLAAGTWKLTINYKRGSVTGSASKEVVL